jgi:hypothetical protein
MPTKHFTESHGTEDSLSRTDLLGWSLDGSRDVGRPFRPVPARRGERGQIGGKIRWQCPTLASGGEAGRKKQRPDRWLEDARILA